MKRGRIPEAWRHGASAVRLRGEWDRWRGTAACVGLSVLSVVALFWLADRSQHTLLGQQIDQASMDILSGNAAATRRLVGVLGNVSLGSIALAVTLLIVVAALRDRWSAAAAAVTLVIGANLTTQAIKAASERTDHGYLTVESFPSGHATVVVSLVLAALLVSPGKARTTVSMLGSAAITVTAAATLVASWHRPADILGAILVSLGWGTAVLAGWSILRGGMPRARPGQHRIFAITGVVLAAAALVAIGVRPDGGWSGFLDASVVLAGVGLVAALAVTTFAQVSAPMAIGKTSVNDAAGADPGSRPRRSGTARPPASGE